MERLEELYKQLQGIKKEIETGKLKEKPQKTIDDINDEMIEIAMEKFQPGRFYKQVQQSGYTYHTYLRQVSPLERGQDYNDVAWCYFECERIEYCINPNTGDFFNIVYFPVSVQNYTVYGNLSGFTEVNENEFKEAKRKVLRFIETKLKEE